MDYMSTPKTNSSKVNIRFLVNETLHKGAFMDRKIDGSNTLLHLAVEYDLHDCVTKLLSSGANTNIKNNQGQTAIDVALANGNQILLQVLGRREDYGKHLQLCNEDAASDSLKQEKILPLTLGAVYEDYLDWTDAKRCTRLKELLETLKNDGAELNQTIANICIKKQKTINKLEIKHNKLRDKEHDLCLCVWEVVQEERNSRKDFEQISDDVTTLKGVVDVAKRKVYWSGVTQIKANVGLVLNRNKWLDAHLEINGEFIIMCSLDERAYSGDVEDRSTPELKSTPTSTKDSDSSSKKSFMKSGPLRRKIQQKSVDAVSKSVALDSLISIVVKRQLATSLSSKISRSNQEYVITELVISCSDELLESNNSNSGGHSRPHSPMLQKSSADRLEVINLRVINDETTGLAEDKAMFQNSEEMEQIVSSIKSLCKQVKVFSSVGGFEVEEDEFSLSQCLQQELLHVEQPEGLLIPQHLKIERQTSEPQSDLTPTPGGVSGSSTSNSPVSGSAVAAVMGTRESMSGLTSIDSLVNTMQDSHHMRVSVSGGYTSSVSMLSSYSTSHRHSMHGVDNSEHHHAPLGSLSESPTIITNEKKTSFSKANSSPRSFRSPSDVLFDATMTVGKNRSKKYRNSIDSADPKELLFEHDVSASVPCRRASTSSSNDEWKRRSSLSLSDQIKAIKNMNGNDVSTENVALIMENVDNYDLATLKRLLNTLRSKRDVIHKKVLDVITTREKLLEKLHFLQALRAVVDNPPRAPTRNLNSTKTPSIEKAVQMLSVYRDHVDNVIDAPHDSMGSTSMREKLSEAEDFVKIMLQDTNIIDEMAFQCDQPKSRTASVASVSIKSRLSFDGHDYESGSGKSSGFASADIVIPRYRHNEELNYGSNNRELSVSFSQSMTNGSIVMQSSSVVRTSSVSWQPSSQISGTHNMRSPMADALYDAARSPFVKSQSTFGASSRQQSLKIALETPNKGQQLFAPQRSESPMRTPSKCSTSEHISIRSSPWKQMDRKEFRDNVMDSDAFGPLSQEDDSFDLLKDKSIDVAIAKHSRKSSQSTSDGLVPVFSPPPQTPETSRATVSTPTYKPSSGSSRKQPFHIFGSPPPEFQEDYDEVMKHLEDIWNCELESFETVGRLAQCLVMREQTWQRLSRLKIQETTLKAPDQDDLYDIEL